MYYLIEVNIKASVSNTFYSKSWNSYFIMSVRLPRIYFHVIAVLCMFESDKSKVKKTIRYQLNVGHNVMIYD